MTDIKRNIAEIEKAAADFVDVEMKPQNMTEGRIGVQSFVAGYRLAESLASQVEAGITYDQALNLAAQELYEFDYDKLTTAHEMFAALERALELALASQVEAGITLKQAKESAGKELGFTEGTIAKMDIVEFATQVGKFVDRAAEIYASSAVQTAIEKERERILANLPDLSVHSLNAEYQELQRSEGSDYASGYDNGANVYFARLRSQLQSIIANK